MTKQFMTAEDVRSTVLSNIHTDKALIKNPAIEVAQEEHIRPVLGDDLYDLLVTENGNENLSAVNQVLMNDYIKPALAFYVKYEILNDMGVETGSAGIVQNTSQFATAATDKQRADLQNRAKSQADTMRDKMVRFLEDEDKSGNDYPLYNRGLNVANFTSTKGGVIINKRRPLTRDDGTIIQ